MKNQGYNMTKRPKAPARRFKRLMGYKGALTRAVNTSSDGAYATLDLATVRALIDVLYRNIAEAKEHEDGQA